MRILTKKIRALNKIISHLGNDFPFQAKWKAFRYTKDKIARKQTILKTISVALVSKYDL